MPPNAQEHNADELEPPKWLNNDFFTKVLQHIEKNEKIEIENLKLAPATAKGDHYASIMFRATIDYKSSDEYKSKTLILKAMPEMEGHKKDVFQESLIFETEIGIYTEVVPKFKEIFKLSGEEDITLGPPCLYNSLSPKKVIIFEDILPLGYEVQRKQQLSLNEVKAAYEKLAKWHAVSHKILQEEPTFFDNYQHGLVNMKTFYSSERMKNGTAYFIEMLAQYEDLLPYKPYFEALNEKNLLKSSVDSFNEYRKNPQKEGFYALCHGDFHYKNLMCKRDPGTRNLMDLMLLDFQLCYVGPAVNDLWYSFFLLLNEEQRHQNFDELLFCYVNQLQETLQKIGFRGRIPKMKDIRSQLMCHKDIVLFILTTFLPMWHSFRDGNFDDNEVAKNADRHRKLYDNAAYLAEVREILPTFLYMGYLEA